VQPRRRTQAIILVLAVTAACLTGCSSSSGSAAATTLPPKPVLGNFVPASAEVTSVKSVQLTPNGPPQLAVTYTSEQTSSEDFTYRDLLVLSWDSYAHRWVNIFDGSKVAAPGELGASAPKDTVLPTASNIVRLEDFPLHSAPGRTDLVFWTILNAGANGTLEVGVIHLDGQTASLAYFENYTPNAQVPTAQGRAPSQQLSIPAGWLTSIDPECCAIRSYVTTVGLKTQTQSGYTSTSYVVTASTQSWLGVYAVVPVNTQQTSPPPNPIVVSVVPGTPAAGVLQRGDQLLRVSGGSAPSSSDLGPDVIDEVALGLPGATIPLEILRNGSPMVVNIALASRSDAAYANTTTPSVSYLGVQVSTQLAQGTTPAGSLVQGVESGSPAESAGLAAGDVITSIGSRPVTSVDALSSALYLTPAFSTVQIAFVGADGVAATTTATTGSFPSTDAAPSVVAI
jgi:hypothetical protein